MSRDPWEKQIQEMALLVGAESKEKIYDENLVEALLIEAWLQHQQSEECHVLSDKVPRK